MEHELKIVMSYQSEDLDHDGMPITPGNVLIYVDGYIVGFMQEFDFHVTTVDSPKIKATFPLMERDKIDDNYFIPTKYNRPLHQSDIEHYAAEMSKFPNVEVEMKNFIDTNQEEMFLDEIGTDGHIDRIKTKG